jgi:hypothetical protein
LRQRVPVVQRFAHAHEDRVELPVAVSGHRRRRQVPLEVGDLLEDLPGLQVAHEAAARGGAEPAGHGAADLRGKAERGVALHGDDHALDGLPVAQPEQELARAVAALLPLERRQGPQVIALGQRLPQCARQVAQLVPLEGIVLEEPACELPGPVGLAAARRHHRAEFRGNQRPEQGFGQSSLPYRYRAARARALTAVRSAAQGVEAPTVRGTMSAAGRKAASESTDAQGAPVKKEPQ